MINQTHETNDVQIAFEDVGLTYDSKAGTFTALKEVNFSVADGEFVAILGPSGCGKSTLLKIVSGLLGPTSGRATWDGIDVDQHQRELGMVFQQATLLPWSTVISNVMVPAVILGQDRKKARAHAKELLDMVGLSQFHDHYPYQLSGGMQQRVGIARSMINDPKVLLMDEPFASLDALTRETMSMELQRIWESSKRTVLFVTHSIPEAVLLADRVLVMSKSPGTIVHEERVDIDRPRDLFKMAGTKFGEICDRLRRQFDL